MPEESIRTVYLNTKHEDYRNFFSDDWGERINRLTEHKPKLSELVFDLMMGWRAAAYTASQPLSILDHMKAFHDAFVNTGQINTTLLRLAEIIPGRLANDLPELTVDPTVVRRIREKLVDIGAEIENDRAEAQVEFPLEKTWESYLADDAFQLSLWGSQRICYVSIYNSYEDFLVRAVSIGSGIDGLRTTEKHFKKTLVGTFGEQIRDKCWTDPQINIARLARHAISHAGGRVTEALGKQNHGFVVRDGRIQIVPENTRALFAMLRDAAFALAESATEAEEFD